MYLISKNNYIKRYIIQLSGIVQGVGFRPYVYKKAKEYNIYGWVNNAGACLVIDAEGEKSALSHFILNIVKNPPLLASIEKTEIRQEKYIGYKCFEIKPSNMEVSKIKQVSPDIGVCPKCMEEVLEPSSARYRYAFTNCTECGPRYSIIKSIPYDRCNTTMKDFIMCNECENEYSNPESRRFHTQPNCCSNCGPKLTLINSFGKEIKGSEPIQRVAAFINAGYIIAIKGLGGFHLCCNGKNEQAVSELRIRKGRPDKPLAVMIKDIASVNKYCETSDMDRDILKSEKRPIVLINKKIPCDLPDNIAPNQKRIGVMLPYLPLHYLLFEDGLEVLVMTSGNISGEPIQYENNEAVHNLKGVADYFLLHDRSIHNPLDDSVVKVILNREMVSRRSRGYIPYTQYIGTKYEILALGAEQKNTFCLSQNGYAYLSQYQGDLKSMDSFELYKRAINNFTNLIEASPKVYAYDSHPQYFSTEYAKAQEGFKIPIQHHHAHMVSCMFEHKLYKDVIGVVFDGTGLGTDGSIWGGEFFIGNRRSFQRVGYLKPILLQGGDTAVKEPWKTAVSYLFELGYDAKHYLSRVNASDIEVVEQAIASTFNCHLSSSMGRFFDCISAMIGLRLDINYDAQAAIELENILDSAINTCYDYCIERKDSFFEIDYESIIRGVISDLEQNVLPSAISAKFHNTISNAVVDTVKQIREDFDLSDVVLSGGVFENVYLLESVYRKLLEMGFNVYFNEQIPINDSGISLGQLVAANEVMKEW